MNPFIDWQLALVSKWTVIPYKKPPDLCQWAYLMEYKCEINRFRLLITQKDTINLMIMPFGKSVLIRKNLRNLYLHKPIILLPRHPPHAPFPPQATTYSAQT